MSESVNTNDIDSTTHAIRYIVCALSLLMFCSVMIYIFRIFHICVPSDILPWCAPFSKLTYLTLFMKFVVVISVTLDTAGDYAIAEVTALLILLGFQSGYRIMFVPQYSREVDIVIKSKDFLLTLIFLIGVLCRLLTDQYTLDVVYFIVFSAVVTVAWSTADQIRRKQMIQKIKDRTRSQSLQIEADNEYALFVMTSLLIDSQGQTASSNKTFGELLDLLFAHIDDCQDNNCICNELENYNELMQLRNQHNQDFFSLSYDQQVYFRKIIEDEGMREACSPLTEISLMKQNPLIGSGMAFNQDESSQNQQQFFEVSNIDENSIKVIKEDNIRENTETITFKVGLPKDVQIENLNSGERAEHHSTNQSNNSHEVKFSPRIGIKPIQPQKRPITTIKKVQHQKPIANPATQKINMTETQQRFLAELLYLFFYDILLKFPESMQMQLFANYFSLKFRRKELLCVFQLRNFPKHKLSTLDYICYTINEQYLLWEIDKIEKRCQDEDQASGKSDGKSRINGDYFIKVNHLYDEFSLGIEKLGQTVVGFWQNLQKPDFDVIYSINTAKKIAERTRNVFKLFHELDELKSFKDYQMYFQLALTNLHILNDPIGFELYIGKMKSILEINQIYHKNFQQANLLSTENSNFLIVDANGQRFGRIIQLNNSLRQLIGWSDEEVQLYTIHELMPQLIQQKHPAFINKFNHTGQAYIINNKTTVFIKKKNGFVIPVEIFIKFHFSIDYQYTFLALIKPFYEMAPFSNGVKYHCDQLLFMIVDNDAEGCITEYSESSVGLFRTYGLIFAPEQSTIQKRIEEIIPDIDMQELRMTREGRFINQEIYEAIHIMSLFELLDQCKVGRAYNSIFASNNDVQNNYHDATQKQVRVKTRIFEEHYSGGALDLNIFCFAFIQETDSRVQDGPRDFSQLQSTTQLVNARINQRSEQQIRSRSNYQNKDINGSIEDEKEQVQEQIDDSSSMTGSSSGASTSTGLAEVRNYDTMGNQKTPRTLSIIIKLIVLLYLIMMGIASINLGINISRQEESQLDINTIKLAYDRMNFLAVNLVLFRVLLNVANGYEPNVSPMSEDRFWRYQTLQEESINNFKRIQADIQQSKFTKSDIFKIFEETQSIELNYLSESNDIYKHNEFINVAFNSYIAKLMEINQYDRESLKGNIGVQKLGGYKDGDNYLPKHQEQILYFVAQNGFLPLRRAAIDACFLYAREAEKHATESISTTLLTAIISIVSIVAIGLLLSPMLTKAETRRFEAIYYFLKIPRDQFPILISKIETYCLHLRDEETYAAIQKEYERLLGIKLINQQIDQLRETDNNYGKKSREQMNEMEMMSSSPPSSYTYSQPPSYTTTRSAMVSKIQANQQFDPKTYDAVQYSEGLCLNKEQESMNSFEVLNDNEPMVPSRITFSNSKQFQVNSGQFAGQKESLTKIHVSSKITGNTNFGSEIQKGIQFKPNISYNNNEQYASKISNESDFSQDKGVTKKKKSSKSRVIEDLELIGKFQKPKKKSSLMHASDDGQNLQGAKGRIQSGMKHDSTRQLASSDRSSNDQQKRSIQSSSKDEDEESEKTVEEFPNEIALQAKQAIIKQNIFRKQLVMIISILGAIAFLSTYFLISFFLSIQTFQTASEVIVALEVVFQKGACLDFSIVFMRASQIRNSTILVRSATQSTFEMTEETYYNAADYYIDFCNQKESEFMQLRKNMPPFFQDIVPFLQTIESPDVCEKLYNESDNAELRSYYPLCKDALNGIMAQGLSNAFTHMINIIRKANLMFSSEDRTEAFLKKQMGDPVMVEIIDMKAKVVNPLLDILNQKSMASVLNYVRSLFLNFLTAFVMFTVVLTASMLILLLVGFRIMKRNMLDTNIVLRIIPFEKLVKEDCEEIKDFFKQ